MKVFSDLEFPQGSIQWLILRSAIPTASELSALLTPKYKVKTGDGPKTYMIKKVTEWFQGGPLPQKQVFAMEQGAILESEAISTLEFRTDLAVQRVGFITTDDGRAGCSPDGLLSDECGLELKCPFADTHVRYLLDGILPEDYEIQVHASMFVTGFKQWKFYSYRRGFPNLLLTIERDEAKQSAIAEALARFYEAFDDAKAMLVKLNGGPPPQLTPMPAKSTETRTTTPSFQAAQDDNEVTP